MQRKRRAEIRGEGRVSIIGEVQDDDPEREENMEEGTETQR